MTAWLARRTLQAVVTYLLAATLAFFLMRLTPGDPLARLSESRPMPPAAIADLRARYGLDQPLLEQFGHFLRGALRGDLGGSIEHNGRPVTALIRERLGASVLLGGTVLLLNFTIGIWLGVWQASRRGRRGDLWVGLATLAAYGTPSFWLGLLLAWIGGVELHWFPTGFMHDPTLPAGAGWLARQLDLLHHLALPAVTLSVVTIAATTRYQRAAMVDALQLDCIRTARTKGLPEARVRWRHAWRNALGPMLALFGLWLPILVAGSVFVESVFAWPGIGTLTWQAIGSRDYPVIMGTTLLVSALVVAGNLFADVAHRLLDPRLRE